jgi:hypothetical protein
MNWQTLACALGLATLVTNPGAAQDQKSAQLTCDIGPVSKTYGGTPWLVYSCNDGHTLVIVAAPGNPGAPFYFMFSPSSGSYRLEGEGTGQKQATDAAVQELKKFSPQDIAALIQETKSK